MKAMRSKRQQTSSYVAFVLGASLLGALLFLAAVAEGRTNQATTAPANDPAAAEMESVRRTRNEAQLQSLKAQLEQRVAKNTGDAQGYYDLAKVHTYLADGFEMRN